MWTNELKSKALTSTDESAKTSSSSFSTAATWVNSTNESDSALGEGKFAPRDKEYLVLDSPYNDPARIRSHLQDGHILYMTEKMLQKLEELGPIINGRKNIRLITVPEEIKAEMDEDGSGI